MKDPSILLFAFSGTNAEPVVKQLDQAAERDTAYIGSSERAIDKFVSEVDLDAYKYVVGFGLYTGPDKDKLRVETRYTNKFKTSIIAKHPEATNVEPLFRDNDCVKSAQATGNSYCNLVSYRFTQRISEEGARTKYNFIHIPRGFDINLAAETIREQLPSLLLSSAAGI